MRALHIADPHLGLTTYSTPGTASRAEDLGETLVRFAEVAAEEKVDLAILPGDLFHTRRPVPRDLLYLGRACSILRSASILTLISGGNHDGPDKVGDERTHTLSWMSHLGPRGVRVFTNAKATTIRLPDDRAFNLVATPYPHKRAFDSVMLEEGPSVRVEALSVAYEQAVTAMVEAVQQQQPDLPTLFMGHVSVVGAALGSEVSMRFGWDVTARSGIFDNVDYAALGHIHRQQQISDKAWYAGSPEYMNFGEADAQKGFLLVDFDKGQEPKVEVIDSRPRQMVLVEVHESESGWVSAIGTIPDGAIVQLTIYPKETVAPHVVQKIVKEYRDAGASYVSYRVVLPERISQPRAQMSAEVEVKEALTTYLTTNGHEVEPTLSIGMELVNSIGAGHA